MPYSEWNAIRLPKSINGLILFAGIVFFAHSALGQSWTHLAPKGTHPAVTGASGVYDPASDRMIVFGGRDGKGDNRNDVWVLTNANGLGGQGQWINLIPNGAKGSPGPRSGQSTAYDGLTNRLIIFGGCGGYCTPALNDVWVLTNANGLGGTPAWTQISPAGPLPTARTNAAAAFTTIGLAGSYLNIVAGQDGSADPCSTFSDVWTLINANGLGGSPAWTQDIASGSPGLNGAAAADNFGSLTLFGGVQLIDGTCQATNEVWRVIIENNEVVSVNWGNSVPNGAAGSPPARSFASAVYDSTASRVLMFGGVDANGNYLNDVWSLVASEFWSPVNSAGGPPPARSGHVAVFDSTNQRMTIFGGADASGVLNDVWVLHAPAVSEFLCFATAGLPPFVRAEGITEQMGDLVLNCTGGTPTPAGKPIPEYTITLTLNTDITSRRLPEAPELSEAVLTIDEPFPAVPSPPLPPEPFQPPEILCTPPGSTCEEKGTGGTPSPYQTQPNVFVGKQAGVNSIQWKVPIDPTVGTQVIRMKNVRANVSQLGIASGLIPIQIQATVGIQGAKTVPVGGSPLTLADSVQGDLASIATSAPIPQCEPHNAILLGGKGNAAFDFSVQVTEIFAAAFKFRNYGALLTAPDFSPALVEQNIPGYSYWTETGFYSPSLFTTAPTIGLADFGTRTNVSFGTIQAGTHLFVPTTITLTGEYAEGAPSGQLQLVQADSNGKSAPGYEPVAATATIGGTPVASASLSGSTAYATYEVIYADPSVLETATIPVAVAFTNKPATGEVQATTSLAPLGTITTASETAPIPRFANFATPQLAYSITSCSAQAAGK
jgi:hypothetical protein